MDQGPCTRDLDTWGHLTAPSLSGICPMTRPVTSWPTCIQRSSRAFHGDPSCWLKAGHEVGGVAST